MGHHAFLITGKMFILDDVLTDSRVKQIYDGDIDYGNYFLQLKEDIECLIPLLDEANILIYQNVLVMKFGDKETPNYFGIRIKMKYFLQRKNHCPSNILWFTTYVENSGGKLLIKTGVHQTNNKSISYFRSWYRTCCR